MYLSYPNTTGLETIDYRLTDPHFDPIGSNNQVYSERSWRLPHSYWCYQLSEVMPDTSPLPSVTTGPLCRRGQPKDPRMARTDSTVRPWTPQPCAEQTVPETLERT
jgi:hypothetical protein